MDNISDKTKREDKSFAIAVMVILTLIGSFVLGVGIDIGKAFIIVPGACACIIGALGCLITTIAYYGCKE